MSLPHVINHLQILRRQLDRLEYQEDVHYAIANQRAIAEQYANADASINALPMDIITRPIGENEVIKGVWLYHPDVAEMGRRMLYIHGCGGGFGRLMPRLSFAAKIAEITATAVFAVDFRQLPQYQYPASLADCLAAYAWMLVHGPEYNSSANCTYILGEAEGGTFALSTLQNIKRRDLKPPNSAVALSPFTDWSGVNWGTLQSGDPFLNRNFLDNHRKRFLSGIDNLKDPRVSPIYGDVEGLPPLLLQVGGKEILLDDAIRFAQKVDAANGTVKLDVFPGMPHAFQLFSPYLSEATTALQRIADFVQPRTGPAKTAEVVFMRPEFKKRKETKQ